MAYCTIRASLKALIIFFWLWSSSACNEPLNFLFEHTDLPVIPCCSFHWESDLWHSWEVTNFFISEGKLFLPVLLFFFFLIFKGVLRGKKRQFFRFPAIVGSRVTSEGSLNSGVKLHFWWLCQLLCLGMDYFPLFFRGLGDLFVKQHS